MLHQRFAHHLYLLGVPATFTRMITERAHTLTGIDIHPQVPIGHHFFIDHGTGIVIGGNAVVGNYVSIYHGVTLGARNFPVDKATGDKIKNLPRHPIVEDNVIFYAGAKVLGRVTVGEGSVVSSNAVIRDDVPPFSFVSIKSINPLRCVDEVGQD